MRRSTAGIAATHRPRSPLPSNAEMRRSSSTPPTRPRRPAEGDRLARGGDRGRRARHDPARRHRLRQDDDDGGDDRGGPAAGADHRPQQDARGAALQRVPQVLPRQRGRVLRLLLRLLPARGVRPEPDLYIEKDSAINEEIDRLRHAATAALLAPPRRDHRRQRVVHLRPRLARDVRPQRR